MAPKVGVLLVNLGTPDSTAVDDIRRYLKQFLSDPRVVDINPIVWWCILNLIILNVRPGKVSTAYQTIWSERGSPLLYHSQDLVAGVQEILGDGFVVALAMRYGNPSIRSVAEKMLENDLEKIYALPLFPQYASATVGSATEAVMDALRIDWNTVPLETLGAFYDDPAYLNAVAEVSKQTLADFKPDHVVFSYHGVPERHVQKSDPTKQHCLASKDCCDEIGPNNRFCYRAQCFATTNGLIERLGLSPDETMTSFQSEFGNDPWIPPNFQRSLPDLAKKGYKRLAVLCPSFVADCLETLEEIAVAAKEEWVELGGEDLKLVPSLNAEKVWVEAVADIVRRAAHRD